MKRPVFSFRPNRKDRNHRKQIPNNLAMHLDAQNVPILGTAAKDIDNAEDRAKFSQMLTNNGINQQIGRAHV